MTHSHATEWWTREDLCYKNQVLHFADRDVEHLARQLGTPSFVYSLPRVLQNLRRIHAALDAAGFAGRHSLYYAIKANRFAPLVTALAQSGQCGIDACSPAEVRHAVSCGFRANQVSFTATSLSAEDLDQLACHKGLFMDCDSLACIRAWGKRAPGTKIGLRINPAVGVGRGENELLHYSGDTTTKFGIYREQFAEALALAQQMDLRVTKIHFHTGCGYLTPQLSQLDRVIQTTRWFIDQVPGLERVNIGGGLGVPHLPGEEKLDLKQWAQLLHRHFGDTNLHLEVEPGDYVIKDAGLLLVSVTHDEVKRDTRFVGINAGFNLAPEPAYYGLPFQPVSLHQQTTTTPATLVGHINEALDVWYRDAQLPCLQEGQSLALINSGAYSAAMSSNHCMRGSSNEVLLLD